MTASTKDLIELARYRASCNAGFEDGEVFNQLADAIERLIAERYAFKRALDDLGVTPEEAKSGAARSIAIHKERDALQEQVKMLRDVLGQINQHAVLGNATLSLAIIESLAATEPKDDK